MLEGSQCNGKTKVDKSKEARSSRVNRITISNREAEVDLSEEATCELDAHE